MNRSEKMNFFLRKITENFDKYPERINISSIHSEKPGGSIAYCTSKASVDMLTKFMAQELTKYKIRVNSINPAFVESNIYLNSGYSGKKIPEYY